MILATLLFLGQVIGSEGNPRLRFEADSSADIAMARKLIREMPIVDTASRSIQTFQMEGWLRIPSIHGESLVLGMRLAYKAPDQFKLMLVDKKDETPIWHYSIHQQLIYNIESTELFYENQVGAEFDFFVKNDKFIFLSYGGRQIQKDRFYFDPQSMFQQEAKLDLTEVDSAHFVVMTTTQAGNRATAEFERVDNQNRLKSLRCYNQARKETQISIEKITIDSAIDQNEFAFPTKEVLRDILHAKNARKFHLFSSTPKKVEASNLLFMRHVAFNGTRTRDLETSNDKSPNWKHIRNRDPEVSRMLRLLFADQLHESNPAADDR